MYQCGDTLDRLDSASFNISWIWASGFSVACIVKLSACLSKVRDTAFCNGSDKNEIMDIKRIITKIDLKKCSGCGMCENLCPDAAIKVNKKK